MLKITFITLALVILQLPINAQLDRSVPPQPGPPPVIQIGDYETFTTKNGIRVIVVENRTVPVVSFQITLDIDRVLEKEAKGYVSMAGELMKTGTENRSKREIDEETDFLGASISTHSRGMFGSSLTRHKKPLLELMSDILLNPTFPEEELERSLRQSRSALSTVRTDAGSMVDNISSALLFGKDHPYGEIVTEETLDNITIEKCRDYYETYFRPNVSYMVIVGDTDVKEAQTLVEKYFGDWKPAEVPGHKYQKPAPPEGIRVAFAERPGAVQSLISVTYPVDLSPGHPDAISTSIMNNILGGGIFSGRLMQNLREDKGYTYGARSSISTYRLSGRFNARTEVRNSVTDSTIAEILYEMERLRSEPVDDETLDLTRNFMTGSFARSLESPRTVANFALNIERYGLPDDYYATYLERLNTVSSEKIKKMAEKHLLPDNTYIIVAGNREVAETLEKFSPTGEVEFFDPFGRPLDLKDQEIPEGVTAENIIEKYIDASGGRQLLEKMEDLTVEMEASTQGMSIQTLTHRKAPDKYYFSMSMGGNILQEQIFDGNKGIIKTPQGEMMLGDEEIEKMKLQFMLNPELYFDEMGLEVELDGIETVDGKNAYRIFIKSQTGIERTDYFDTETGLRLRTVATQESPMGEITQTTTFSDYRTINTFKYPFKIIEQAGPQSITMEVIEIRMNTGLENEIFKIE